MQEVTGAPSWACDWLGRRGYRPGNVMDGKIAEWWGWYTCRNDFFEPPGADPTERRATLHPARMVCDEWASLLMNERTVIKADGALGAWLSERAPSFVEDNADFVSRAFALGTGAWACDLGADGLARVRRYGAEQVVPLACDSEGGCQACAFVARVTVGGAPYDQIQVHEPGEGGPYVLRTWLFEPGRGGEPVACEGVVPEYDTRSELPTFALAAPAVANTYEANTPLGASVFDCGTDALRYVDEVFDLMLWGARAGKTRVMVDEQSLVVDPKTGRPLGLDTIDKRLYKALRSAAGEALPVSVYNPDLRAADTRELMGLALSMLSSKCGLGPRYWSFEGGVAVRTATEVSADSSQLFRNVRRHENALGPAIVRAVRGAWAMEEAARSGRRLCDADVPGAEVVWDDSIVTDTATERAQMKDDIARGLCPAHLYPMRYYGLDEAEARALTAWAAPGAAPEEA